MPVMASMAARAASTGPSPTPESWYDSPSFLSFTVADGMTPVPLMTCRYSSWYTTSACVASSVTMAIKSSS